MTQVRIVLASREVYPFGGGGIGQFVAAAARLLSSMAEVTVLTTSIFEPAYESMRRTEDPRLPPGIRFSFVPEPTVEEASGWYHVMHCYGARLLERLRELFPDDGPELIEFPDFLGEAFVPLQAARAHDPLLARTRLCVRLHTSAELCEVLDGFLKLDDQSRALHAMERFALAQADRVIWQGGDILGTYQRFYGADGVAPAVRIPYPYYGPAVEPAADAEYRAGSPLRLLYAGRLERRKGIHNLLRAMTGLQRDDFRLTLVGGDTPTGPLGTSMLERLELAAADDPRVEFAGQLDREALAEAIRSHDAVVVPSLWECWPYAALEPLQLNRPVLGTPVGGLAQMLQPGRNGWRASGTGSVALEQALERLLGERDELEAMVRGGEIVASAHELADHAAVKRGYEELLELPPAGRRERPADARRSRGTLPLVSAVVPYYRAARFVADTVESLRRQTYPRLEIVLVNDGSFSEEDWVVAELSARAAVVVVTQMNQGLGAARNFGIAQSQGRYVFPLDADNVAEPDFVARCVEVLEGDSEVAYVTAWSRYIDSDGAEREGPALGYQPLGNHAEMLAADNVAGDAAALIRRRLFDAGFRYSEELPSYEDWHFYRELQRGGHIGAVIPERLLRYRVRDDSMQAQFAQPNRQRLMGEMEALIRENDMRWTSSSG